MGAWIGLGGNRGNSVTLLESALSLIGSSGGISLLRHSKLYRSAPWGVADQPDFFNAVAELDTQMQPLQLLLFLQKIETDFGRERGDLRWGPRCIDLDLLTYNDLVLRSKDLQIPHPRMHQRAFVLVPILELDPDFRIPGRGKAADCLNRIGLREVESVVPMC